MSGLGQGIVFKDASFWLDGVDLSTWVREVNTPLSWEEIDSTGMQAPGKEVVQGDRVDQITVKFKQDFSAAAVDATLFPIFESGSHVDFTLRAFSTAVAETNPDYRGTCRLSAYEPFTGARGTLLEPQVTFPVVGAVTRHTT